MAAGLNLLIGAFLFFIIAYWSGLALPDISLLLRLSLEDKKKGAAHPVQLLFVFPVPQPVRLDVFRRYRLVILCPVRTWGVSEYVGMGGGCLRQRNVIPYHGGERRERRPYLFNRQAVQSLSPVNLAKQYPIIQRGVFAVCVNPLYGVVEGTKPRVAR